MKYLNKFVFAIALATSIMGFTAAQSAQAENYVVVINTSNSFAASDEEARQQILRIFLKQQTAWPGSLEAFPLDRDPTDQSHGAFLSNVLQMTDQEVASHWLRVKQQTGQTPPRVVGASRILLRLIGRRDGGMGVVKESELEGAPDNIKVLYRFSD